MDAPAVRPAPWARSADEVVAELGTDATRGLSSAEAASRRASYGANELAAAEPVPPWRMLLAQVQDPLVYLLGVATAVSLAAWVAEGAAGVPVDAVVIAAIVVANAVIGFVQQRHVEQAVAALAALTAASSTVVRDGIPRELASVELVPGDVLVLAEGDSIGADARVVSARGLSVSEAALTGESSPVGKDTAPGDPEAAVGDRSSMVFKGCAVTRGGGTAVVTATGMATEMGAIADLLERTEAEPSPLQRELATVSRAIGLAVLAVAAVVMVTLAVVNGVHSARDLVTILLLGVSLAVAAVPEGLPAVLSLVLALGVRAMAGRGAIVKALHSVETLGSASVVCSDKTGTLTRNEMTLRTVVTPSGRVELGGAGYRPVGEVRVVASGSSDAELLEEVRHLLVAGSVANNATLEEGPSGWQVRGDPTEGAFLVAAAKVAEAGPIVDRYHRVAEAPFDSDRKRMSTLAREQGSREHRLFVKGAADVLLGRCRGLRRAGRDEPLDEGWRATVLGWVEELSRQGFRTLGVATRDLGAWSGTGETLDPEVEEDLVLLGVVGIIDAPRDEAAAAVAEAQRAGVRVVMITGDHPATATSIAADLGIVTPGAPALTGAELSALSDRDLVAAARDVAVYARVSPEHKLRIVDALQADGHIVAMTGDGVNDAPALKSADIGVAMGRSGTEVARQASRMVLSDDNFATIIVAVRQGRVVFDNIRKFLRYLLSSNMGEVLTVFLGVLLAGPLGLAEAVGPGQVVVPLLATQILWINLVTDSGPALALGVDPELDDVMARPPRRPDEPILDREMWHRILLVGVAMAAVTLATLDIFLPGGLVSGHDSLPTARTAAFTTLVLTQLANALASRSGALGSLRDLGSNRWLLGSLALALVLQVLVVHVPVLQHAFGTTSLGAAHWVCSVAAAGVVLAVVDLDKRVRRGSPQPR